MIFILGPNPPVEMPCLVKADFSSVEKGEQNTLDQLWAPLNFIFFFLIQSPW